MNVIGKTLKILWTHCEYVSILENLLAFPTNELREPLNLACGHTLASEENLWTFVVKTAHFWTLFHASEIWIPLNFGEPLIFVQEHTLNSEERVSTFSVNIAHI